MARFLAPLLCALAALLVVPAAGHAASYDAWLCRGPAGEPAGTAPLVRYGDGPAADSCASGGSFDVALAAGGHSAGDAAGARIAVPGGVSLTSAELWRSDATSFAFSLGFGHYAAQVVQAPGTSSETRSGCDVASDCSEGSADTPLGDANRVATTVSPLGGLAIEASCRGGGCGDPGGVPARLSLFRAHLVADDPAAPVIGSANGSLSGGTVDASGSLEVVATDAGSGVCTVRLLVDGTPAATRSLCTQPYSTLAPGQAASDVTLTADTSALLAGTHTVAVEVADAAGTVTRTTRTFDVSHGGASTPQGGGSPTTVDPALGLRVEGTVPARVPVGRSVVLVATAPAGATLRLEQRSLIARNAPWTFVRVLPLGQAGRLRTTVRADGARAYRVRRAMTTSGEVRVVSTVALTLRKSASKLLNGRRLTLSGTLRGAGSDAASLRLQVQAVIRGRYVRVATIRPSRSGAFRWRYRFEKTRAAARYRFRVRFVAPRGSLLRTSSSSPVTVLVRP